MHKHLILLTIFSFFSVVSKAECPSWITEKKDMLPLCPKEGSLLPETFPTAAVVVSDIGSGDSLADTQFTVNVVEKVLMSSKDRNPLIILPVTNKTLSSIKERIDKLDISAQKKELWKKSLVQINGPRYTWQQDYFQPTVSESGSVELRPIQGYDRALDSFVKVSESLKSCGFKVGSEIKIVERSHDGQSGGNIEALPGGLCAVGNSGFRTDKDWQLFTSQFCGANPENKVWVQTSWLKVGHTDEVLKVLKNNKKSEPCNFSVAIASPKKALELLKNNPKQQFLSFPNLDNKSYIEASNRRSDSSFIKRICDTYQILNRKRPVKIKTDGPTRATGQVSPKTNGVERRLASSVLPQKSYSNSRLSDCAQMTNAQAYEVFTEDKSYKILNQLVQKRMDELKQEISLKIEAKIPGCKPDFVDVPNLFHGGHPVELGGDNYMLPNKMMLSVLPNPTNSISIEDTSINPEPGNKAFKEYISSEYKKRGLSSEFIDTFDYGHIRQGNLHCATNTIHICKPRDKK